jgi:hypothetical protein
VVHQLIDERGALQMPPIASLIVDAPDVAVVASWIQAMGELGDAGDLDASAPPEGGNESGSSAEGGRDSGGGTGGDSGGD